MINNQLVSLARELVAAAAGKNLTARVLGGTAVYMTCPSLETHPALQRTVKDLDLVALPHELDALAGEFEARGVRRVKRDAAGWVMDLDGVEIELGGPYFRENHRIDLSSRLQLSSPTLPLADLLLIKLQRKDFKEKDIQDSIALLLDHRAARGEEEDQIDHQYIARLCARDWGLFRTVYDNFVTLEKTLDKYVEPEEAQLVWRRLELIQGDMDAQPKTLRWMLNQVIRRPAQVPA